MHIVAGSIAIITGTLNMIRKKGNTAHKKVGNIFVGCMMITGFSALFMAVIKPNPFLFGIGIFTIYLVGTAKRYLQTGTEKPKLMDWIYTLGMFIFSISFSAWGIQSVF